MTEPFASLERSLREGPPDESGYRDHLRELEVGIGGLSGTGITPLQPVMGLSRTRRGQTLAMSVQLPIAALVVAAIAVGGVMVAMRNNPIVTGPIATATTSPGPTPTDSQTPPPSAEPSPTPAASNLPSPAAISIPPLAKTFTSARNGFSIDYPADWTARPATQSWPTDTKTQLGSPMVDQLELAGTYRLIVASQRLSPGQTEAQWVSAYFPPYQGAVECPGASDLAASPRLTIDGRSGYLRLSGCPVSADVAMSPADIQFEAFVFTDDRVYQITLDGDIDLAFFEAIVSTITLDPASAIDPPA